MSSFRITDRKWWNHEDTERLVAMWPTATPAELAAAFPGRSYKAMKERVRHADGPRKRPGPRPDYERTGAPYPWKPISELDRLGYTHWGYITAKGQLVASIGLEVAA